MAKKERMGSGLDLLFEDNFHESDNTEDSGNIQTLRISYIEPDKNQPRKNFDEERLQELADNITEHGILQPILVRPLDNGSYRIVAGERRWRAARLAGLTEVPVIIREFDDLQTAQIALIENLQREDLDPIEEARAFRRLMDEFGMTQEQLAKSVGKSRPGIANSVRLLSLPEHIQEMVTKSKISVGHAKLLCGIEDEVLQNGLAVKASEGLSVRQLEDEINTIRRTNTEPIEEKPDIKPKIKEYTDPFKKYAAETELSFRQLCGIDAKLARERNGGYSVKFKFGSEEELKDFIGKISDVLG